MIAILLCKLFESKSNRDYAQILALSLLIIVTASIFSSAMVFGLILMVYLATGLYTILLFHLRAETDRALLRRRSATTVPAKADRTLRRDVRAIAAGMGIAMFALGTLLFLMIPRARRRICRPLELPDGYRGHRFLRTDHL